MASQEASRARDQPPPKYAAPGSTLHTTRWAHFNELFYLERPIRYVASAEGLPQVCDGAGQRLVGNGALAPDGADEFLPLDDLAGRLGEAQQHVHHARREVTLAVGADEAPLQRRYLPVAQPESPGHRIAHRLLPV